MIRSLLTPEAHRDPYVWAAVLVAHAGIGMALWVITASLIVAAASDALFEAVQAVASRRPLFRDSTLDWTAVCLGACLGWAIEAQDTSVADGTLTAIAVIAATGARVRTHR